MSFNQKTPEDDIPNWWNQAPTVTIIREVEDATAQLYIRKKFDPKKVKKEDVKFSDIRPILKMIHKRYWTIRIPDFVPNKRLAFKGMH